MPVVDYLLNSLIKKLQKTQRTRRKKQRAKKAAKARKAKKKQAAKKVKRSVTAKRKKRSPGRSAKRILRKPAKKKAKKKTKKKTKKKKSVRSKPKPKPKKKTVRKSAKSVKKAQGGKKVPEPKSIADVTHFFSKIKVIVIKVTAGKVSVGQKIRIKGRATDFTQKIDSLQIESVDVKSARKGQLAGLKVRKKAKPGDKVYIAP